MKARPKEFAYEVARSRAHAIAAELSNILDLDPGLYRMMEADLGIDRADYQSFPLSENWVGDTTGEIVQLLRDGRSLAEALFLAKHLAEIFERAGIEGDVYVSESRVADKLVSAIEAAGRLQNPASREARGRHRQACVSPVASRLALAAARILPVAERSRYAQEFKSELADIALAGGGRVTQVAYGTRQVRSAVSLRAALRSPVRRSAVP